MTVVIQIGNSDNKLSQYDWSRFVESVQKAVDDYCDSIHFLGGSEFNAPWQNACWVTEVRGGMKKFLFDELQNQAKKFHQDSIAVTIGETQFIKGE